MQAFEQDIMIIMCKENGLSYCISDAFYVDLFGKWKKVTGSKELFNLIPKVS